MNDSTISWMIMGGPRDDEHSQDPRHLDHMRALRESRASQPAGVFSGSLTRLQQFLGRRTADAAPTTTADCCFAA